MRKPSYEYVKAWRARHPDLRAARREEGRKYRLAHPDKVKENCKRYQLRHREEVLEYQRKNKREWRKKNPTIQRARELEQQRKRVQKLEQLMGRPRPSLCELCNGSPYAPGNKPRIGICFDHDHSTGKPRGWLCDRCNKVLGLVKDNPSLLRLMAEYLEKHSETDSIAA